MEQMMGQERQAQCPAQVQRRSLPAQASNTGSSTNVT